MDSGAPLQESYPYAQNLRLKRERQQRMLLRLRPFGQVPTTGPDIGLDFGTSLPRKFFKRGFMIARLLQKDRSTVRSSG
jgi:hypothetical protein